MSSCTTSPPQPLLTSPVAVVFPDLCWNPWVAKTCGLNESEKTVLRRNPEATFEYVQVLLKLLEQQQTCSSSPSSRRVSTLTTPLLTEKEALGILYVDSVGVVTHYAIHQLYDMLQMNEARTIQKVFSCIRLEPLIRILNHSHGDDYAQQGAALCLAHILTSTLEQHQQEQPQDSPTLVLLQQCLSWVALQFMSCRIEIAMPSLQKFIASSRQARYIFAECGGIGCLATCCCTQQGEVSTQHLYEMTFVLWHMTLDVTHHDDHHDDHSRCTTMLLRRFARDGAVPALVEMVVAAPREKVVRMALASLVNLATIQDDDSSRSSSNVFTTQMMDCDLCLTLNHYMQEQEQHWKDIDMVNDLELLHKLLQNHKEAKTNDWDVYVAQVESGIMEWGAIHTSQFMQQHVKKFEGSNGDFSMLKRLIELVVVSTDDDTIAIACFDIGEFVRHYPNGRSIVKSLGAKEAVMGHLNHVDPDVQRHALQAVSKILVRNWQGIQSYGS